MAKRRAPRPSVADVAAAAVQASRGGGCLEPAVVVAQGFASPEPVEPKALPQAFEKAAAGNPRLRTDLEHLLATHPPSDLVALGKALIAIASVARAAPRRRGGPRPRPVPEAAEAAAKLWGHRLRAAREQSGSRSAAAKAVMAHAVSKVAPLLSFPPGAGDQARRARRGHARELIGLYAKQRK